MTIELGTFQIPPNPAFIPSADFLCLCLSRPSGKAKATMPSRSLFQVHLPMISIAGVLHEWKLGDPIAGDLSLRKKVPGNISLFAIKICPFTRVIEKSFPAFFLEIRNLARTCLEMH